MGGLSKKSQQIKELQKNYSSPFILLDAGNLLFKKDTVSEPQELIKASGILKIYGSLNYDALAIGPHDLSAGLAFLQDSQKNGIPWLSANILDAQQKPLFQPSKILERSGLVIGIIGLTGTDIPTSHGISVGDWQHALSSQLTYLEKKCDLIIALSTLAAEDNAKLAEMFPQVHILITARPEQGNVMPRIINKTLITQTYSQGKYLGLLQLDWHPDKTWDTTHVYDEIAMQDRVNVLNRQILRAERRNSLEKSGDTNVQEIREERKILLDQIEAIRQQTIQNKEKLDTANSFQHSFIALKRNLPDDPEIAEKISKIKEQINNSNRTPQRGNSPRNEEKSEKPSNWPKGYTGSQRCYECHTAQVAFWRSSKHAKAYQTLVEQRQNFNLDCLTCHVTAPAETASNGAAHKPNLVDLPPELRGVGCETCHGPGLAHASEPEKKRTTGKTDEQTCLTCHTKDHSAGFIYLSKISQISCPAQ